MKLAFLQLPADERRLYFEQAALRRGISPVIMEKEFWVCWTLAVLFDSEFADAIVFKGGTSLSKVFGAIERFSEDIDLSLAPKLIGIEDTEPPSRNKAEKWMKQAEVACAAFARDQLQPALEAKIAGVLGPRENGWLEFQIDPASKSPVLLFHYPTVLTTQHSYIQSSVKLELGSLTDQQPTGQHTIRPWIAETIPQGFEDWKCTLVALEVERTFWEKATILHTEYHRPVEKPMPARFSRHYADTAALARLPLLDRALSMPELRDRVVAWKGLFFGGGWTAYDSAKPPTFRLVPPEHRLAGLRVDYQAMRDMYLAEPLSFDEVLQTLSELEKRING